MRGIGKIHHLQHQVKEKQQEMRKAFLQRMRNGSRESEPVFLVGCGRSGTSMLIWQLNNSWQVTVYNENHPAAFDNFRLLEHEIVAELVNDSQAPRTLFKPILDTVQTNLLLENFPDGKVLFPFRYFDDVINSSLKKFGVYNRIGHVRRWMEDDFAEFAIAPPPEQTKQRIRNLWQPNLGPESGAALYWLFYNHLYRDMGLDQDERVLLIQYETLVTKPREQFQRVVDHLGIELEACMVDGVFASSIGRDSKPPVEPAIREACETLYAELSALIDAPVTV